VEPDQVKRAASSHRRCASVLSLASTAAWAMGRYYSAPMSRSACAVLASSDQAQLDDLVDYREAGEQLLAFRFY
jgi:hypothetical protein